MTRELTDTSAHDLHYGFRCRRVIAPSLEAHAGAVPSRRRFSDMSNFGHLSARIPIGRCDRRAQQAESDTQIGTPLLVLNVAAR